MFPYSRFHGQTAAYAENPQIEVLENNDSVHAVRHNGLGMTGINFWNDGGTTAAGVTSDSKASVMMQQTADTLEIAVSDPTQENNGTIELTVDIPCTAVISKDDTVTVNEVGDQVKISVNVAGAMGGSHTVKLQLEEQVDKSSLQGLYDSVKSEMDSLNEEDYTADSWKAVMDALDSAKTVLEKEDATQEEVNAAYAALDNAKKGLTPDEETEEPEKPGTVNKDALYALLEQYGGRHESDYTAESWAPFKEAYDTAKAVYLDGQADQAAVDKAAADLKKTGEALVKVSETTPPSGDDGQTTVKPDDQDTPSATGTQEGAVQTGVTENIGLLLLCAVLLVLSAGTAGAVIRRKHV